jgi:hypothetical protein
MIGWNAAVLRIHGASIDVWLAIVVPAVTRTAPEGAVFVVLAI